MALRRVVSLHWAVPLIGAMLSLISVTGLCLPRPDMTYATLRTYTVNPPLEDKPGTFVTGVTLTNKGNATAHRIRAKIELETPILTWRIETGEPMAVIERTEGGHQHSYVLFEQDRLTQGYETTVYFVTSADPKTRVSATLDEGQARADSADLLRSELPTFSFGLGIGIVVGTIALRALRSRLNAAGKH